MGSILNAEKETSSVGPGQSTSPFEPSEEYASHLDSIDPLSHFRSEFIIPSKADLKRPTLAKSPDEAPSEEAIYLCGNSLGLQSHLVSQRIQTCLAQWSNKAVTGHFISHSDSPLTPFLHADDHAAKLMAPVVGALESEVAIMGTLTANLHLMMASFYRPTKDRYKIVLEGKAFPSDHYAVESQITHHGFDTKDAMILIEPEEGSATLTTEQIMSMIDKHAAETALVLLPGIQYFTGQYFDIQAITRHAHAKGLLIGWDCAHAAGNVDLQLHHWDVDFAVWCSYKYLNSGPGAMAALFVHEKHGAVDMKSEQPFRPRLTGWWGDEKESRFEMENKFVPRAGAAGYQLSNPSALDLSAVIASLEIFNKTTMSQIREKSLSLTAYLEYLLQEIPSEEDKGWSIITPRSAKDRGAQLSIRLQPGTLAAVFKHLDAEGVIVDERKPDVIRVAPAPLYNSYTDVWKFVHIFVDAVREARTA